VRFIKIKNLLFNQKQEILQLWNNEYPRSLQYNDISELEEYLNKLEDPKHILLVDSMDKIKGWYSEFYRDNEKWFLAILDSEIQGRNFGTQLIKMGKEGNVELNGWIINSDNYIKSNGKFYRSPTTFYLKQGFQILKDIKLETGKISAIKIKWSQIENNGR
jgi:hypothetical protein